MQRGTPRTLTGDVPKPRPMGNILSSTPGNAILDAAAREASLEADRTGMLEIVSGLFVPVDPAEFTGCAGCE